MNNFSPSTDTSVGTKRFTAQEVQLAYTLMAVEYMKTIKGLNPNHQLVDKAVKLKALGFINSKEVGDAITSEEDLKVLKCYSFLQRHFPGSLILKEEDFINLNVNKLLLTLCLLIACPIRLEGTSLGRNLPILDLCI